MNDSLETQLKKERRISIGSIDDVEKKFGFLFAQYLKNVLSFQDDDEIVISAEKKNLSFENHLVVTTALNSSFDWENSVKFAKDSEIKVANLLFQTFSQYGPDRLNIQFDAPNGKSHFDFRINSKTVDVKISKSYFEIEIARIDGFPSGIFNEQVADYWIMVYPSLNKNDEPYRGSLSIISTKRWREILADQGIVQRYAVQYPDINDYRKGRTSVRIPYSELIDTSSMFYKSRVFIGEIQVKLSNSGKIGAYDFSKFVELSAFFKKQYLLKRDLDFIQIVDYVLSL